MTLIRIFQTTNRKWEGGFQYFRRLFPVGGPAISLVWIVVFALLLTMPGFAAAETTVRRKAVIVAGGGPSEGDWVNFFWEDTVLCADYAYNTLRRRGYPHADIQYLTSAPSCDVDGNGFADDKDGPADLAALSQSILAWAVEDDGGPVTEELVLFLVDHGGPGTFRMNPTEILDAAVLNGWLNTLQNSLPGRVTVIYQGCNSGSFLPLLTPPAGKERIVAADAAADEQGHSLNMGFWSFSFQFWAAIAGGFDLHTAFISARDAMKSYQTPQLDVDGDGVGNEKADYEGAVNLFIDGRLVSADPVPYLVPTRLTPATTTSDSATLSVRVGPPGVDLRHLWALVVSPVDSPGNPATQISTLAFSPGEKSGIYEGTYDGFIMDGIYRMLLFASTPADLNSAPVLMEVIRQNGILLADMDGNGIYDEVDSAIGLNILAGRYDERLRPDHALSDMNKNQRIDPEETAFVLQKRIQISPSY